MRIVLYLALTSNGPPRIKLTLKPNISTISVNSARKPEGVGVRGQGKVAFSHALRLPLPRKLNVTITEVGPAIMWPGPRLSSLQEKVSDC